MRKLVVNCLVIGILFVGCKKESPGPYFGNGFHNGWADQNSVVIWTRLTKSPEMNTSGKKFLIPSAADHRCSSRGMRAAYAAC